MIQVREIKQVKHRLSVHIHKKQIQERTLLKKHIAGRKYHAKHAYWSIPYTKDTLYKISQLFKGQYQLCFTINPDIPDTYNGPFYVHNTPHKKTQKKALTSSHKAEKHSLKYANALDALEQSLILKRYSYATIKSYKSHLKQFLYYYNPQKPSTLAMPEIKAFIFHKIKNERIAERTQNQLINALKYFYERVVGREKMFITIERPKVPKDLPNFLSLQEVERLIKCTHNLKHKAIIMTLYAGGLRLSDVLNLKISDIRSNEGYIRIQAGKGKKDRFTLLAPTLLHILRQYYKEYRPSFYLFEGQNGGKYSQRSVQNIIKQAVKKSGVHKATPHTLRHSFATHLVQNGTDIKFVKELLGHNSIKTTEIYLHVSRNNIKNINSPLEKLNL